MDLTFDEIATEVLEELTADALLYFRRALEAKRLVLTEELMRSFRYHIVRSATQVAAEIDLLNYGRFKDMRQLRYRGSMPPIDAMEFFVEKVGIGNFAYVSGYWDRTGSRIATVPNAVRRIAAGISFSRKVYTTKRPYSGTWYNETKMNMVNVGKKRLAWRTSEWIAAQIKMTAEEDTD
ncbi:hypothetical protein [Arsenicibacter rosenii]|uniref:Uncharacterized protein n=1 Tax=Arsenicibacter rosenii TaxID=1750698 RepID=A0A1S2VQW8_9BACT|nr:hypothetical protein [Arsenicibacter rosenii]OIN61161.1 hypothetical protein BLX24_03625 [Arsenicibacter rosenii]